MSIIRFEVYRRHESARIEANDAMVTLLISSRLGRHVLDLFRGSESYLPEVFPEIDEVRKLNRSISDTRTLMEESERYLALMAIPFVLSIHQEFTLQCVRLLLNQADLDLEPSSLEKMHEYLLSGSNGGKLDADELSLFQLTRRIRNRILHYGSLAGSGERTVYTQTLNENARELWERRAGRPLSVNPGEPIGLGAGELFATLAVAKALADATNELLVEELPRERWALMAAEEYAQVAGTKKLSQSQLRGFAGFCSRQRFQNLKLTDDEVGTAWTTVVANQKEGSTN